MSTPEKKSPTPVVLREAAVDWVKFDAQLARDGSVDPVDKALYAALASFVDQSDREAGDDPDGEDVPTRRRLAACIGRSVDTVDRATRRLEERGLLDVERRQDPANPRKNLPSAYRLLDGELWDERAAQRAEKRRAERAARKAAKTSPKAAPPQPREAAEPVGESVEGWPHGCGQGGRTDAARVAARMRPGWPHQCGGSSSSQEPQENPPLPPSTDSSPNLRSEEDEERPAAGKHRVRGSVVEVIAEHTGASAEEAGALAEILAAEATKSLSGYVRTLTENGDLAHRLELLRRQSAAQAPQPRSGEAAGCSEHGELLPCGACRGDVLAGDVAVVEALLAEHGPQARPDLAEWLAPAVAGGAR